MAKPSKPSVKLTEFEPPTIANQPIIKKPIALSGMIRSLKKGIKSSAPMVFEFKLRSQKQIKRVLIVCAESFCLLLSPSEFCFLIFK